MFAYDGVGGGQGAEFSAGKTLYIACSTDNLAIDADQPIYQIAPDPSAQLPNYFYVLAAAIDLNGRTVPVCP